MYATGKKNKNLALFDFDGTLCKKDSFTGFIFYALSKRHIVKQGIKILPWIQAYYLNVYSAPAMRSRLFRAMFSNANALELQQMAREYATSLMSQLNRPLLKQLKQHQALGDDVVLVSASVDVYLKHVCELLNIDLICTHTEQINNIYTGQYTTPDCSSEQKRQRILERYHLADYAVIYAYGNSHEDQEMLALADHGYMVGGSDHLPNILDHKKLA
ncbi:HAD-IB family hydrolase [Acinetobacter sp. C_4_1]|uniref:HAD-IB family hydrolase n=1 Tax=unclassified Acinetobacter TaxID=196816 RepID=UPI0021B7E114|nr:MULTISPECIES: HAD-IB family hydrolase [unclassified Acinetobacter]MCT8090775.1 HAD-IB family hydrolase [Acinetobacter sp. F_3_1]MCT8099203.1 HAD-IB family hydrolase [Acinetobacter sp. C_3_1]MCT8102276.1 HAD-IB family hydrolase [Acinetobacter sp. C_4_1]MCT8136023.1 HAD-IB family hydrolase [Acinetobacter sp. T_3_1]